MSGASLKAITASPVATLSKPESTMIAVAPESNSTQVGKNLNNLNVVTHC
jgi:hypothetical protein